MRVKFFEQARDMEQEKLVGYGSDQLQSDGKAGGGEAARDRDCGDSCKVRGTIQAQEERAGWVIFFSYRCAFFADQRSGNRRGRNNEGIDTGVGH